jgi:phospholipase C
MPPTNLQDRIKHVIVLALENRSFDHFFGFFPPAGGQTIENLLGANSHLFNLLDPAKPESGDNPRFTVSQPAPFAVHDKEGPSHSFNAVCVQLCNDRSGPTPANPARNNGFVRSYKDDLLRRTHQVDFGHISEVMKSFGPVQLPAINQLAREFCLCDHWFCDVPGPTMPNRMFLHAATSEGYVHNDFKRTYRSRTVYELFEEKGLTWATYFHDLNEVLQFANLAKTPDHFRRFEERWASDVAQGNLPNYTFILPRFVNKKASNGSPARPANSQHAPEDVRFGEHLIADVYDALAANTELWNQSVLIVTYDEHGGFYDHVIPGAAPNPDRQNSPNPDDHASFSVPAFAFDRLGLRVPAVIASPWISKGADENRALQHTSVIRTVTEMFGLNELVALDGELNDRSRSAASFADLFTRLDAPRPPGDMPAALDRPPLENAVVSFAAGVPVHPADEPLDSLTEEWVQGVAALTQEKLGVTTEAIEPMPTTQGEASDFVERRLREAFGI